MSGPVRAQSKPALVDEARKRLLQAWRGEILAGAVYELIARRMSERDAAILRKMAEAEGSHRRRLERRMAELDIPIPDAASVKVPFWLRLQARIAPVQRLLAVREAAEDDEVADLYRRSTGDLETDQLLREIRHEERAHSRAVQEIRAGRSSDHPGLDRAAAQGSPPTAVPAVPAAPERDPQARLDRILKRERWHRSGGGWISGAIYGAN